MATKPLPKETSYTKFWDDASNTVKTVLWRAYDKKNQSLFDDIAKDAGYDGLTKNLWNYVAELPNPESSPTSKVILKDFAYNVVPASFVKGSLLPTGYIGDDSTEGNLIIIKNGEAKYDESSYSSPIYKKYEDCGFLAISCAHLVLMSSIEQKKMGPYCVSINRIVFNDVGTPSYSFLVSIVDDDSKLEISKYDMENDDIKTSDIVILSHKGTDDQYTSIPPVRFGKEISLGEKVKICAWNMVGQDVFEPGYDEGQIVQVDKNYFWVNVGTYYGTSGGRVTNAKDELIGIISAETGGKLRAQRLDGGSKWENVPLTDYRQMIPKNLDWTPVDLFVNDMVLEAFAHLGVKTKENKVKSGALARVKGKNKLIKRKSTSYPFPTSTKLV